MSHTNEATIPYETFLSELEKLSPKTVDKFLSNQCGILRNDIEYESTIYTNEDIRYLNMAKSNTLDKLKPRKMWTAERTTL